MSRRVENRFSDVLITGGAGFIGTNLAAHLLATTDARITLFDNLSHPAAGLNLAWLKTQAHAGRVNVVRGDVRSAARVIEVANRADEIYHLAARCEVGTASRTDYDINVGGTQNVLEAARCSERKPVVVYVSTAKVYGSLRSIEVWPDRTRYRAVDRAFQGVSEHTPVEYHSPYHCAKGAAERCVLDYSRFYNLPAVVLRPDTVAGPRQFENEGHGWVAHFVYSVLAGYPITIYGNGLQVRDVLHVDDLVEAMVMARAYIGVTSGHAYNVGGGMSHAISVREMIRLIERVCYRAALVRHESARPGDRELYVADASAFAADTGWYARQSIEQTVREIAAFWHASHSHEMQAGTRRRTLERGFREAA